MVIPKSVLIGPYTYDVSVTSGEGEDNIFESGFIDHEILIIKICGKQALQRQLETFIHEIQHGIFHVANLEDGAKEEDIVARTTPFWLGIFKDNPKLLDLIQEYASEISDGNP